MANNARYGAIETLHRLSRTRHPVAPIFSGVVEACRLAPADRQLAMNMVFGVLRHRDQIDRLIIALCPRPPDAAQSWIRQALSVGLYQLFFLDRIPAFAAVDETVKALQHAGYSKKIRGFVNGVLRESLRRRDYLHALVDPGGTSRPLLNHPSWLTHRWQNHFGAETMRSICEHNNREPPLCLRISRSIDRETFLESLSEAGIAADAGELAPNAVLLPDFQGSITALPGYQEGLFQVQDQSAQLATFLLAPFLPLRYYLDCCAGLGGKTIHLAELLPAGDKAITAIEPDPGRFRLLQENLARMGGGRSIILYNDTLERFARTCPFQFDAILVDAPCSGTGVIGRQPDIRWNRQERELLAYQHKQHSLLATAAELLVPGGVLVYATCSIEPEENEQVVAAFLSGQPAFRLTDCHEFLPQSAHHLIKNRCLAPLPTYGQDGFFAARLYRIDST